MRKKYKLGKISNWSLFTRIHCATNTFWARMHCATNNSLACCFKLLAARFVIFWSNMSQSKSELKCRRLPRVERGLWGMVIGPLDSKDFRRLYGIKDKFILKSLRQRSMRLNWAERVGTRNLSWARGDANTIRLASNATYSLSIINLNFHTFLVVNASFAQQYSTDIARTWCVNYKTKLVLSAGVFVDSSRLHLLCFPSKNERENSVIPARR